MRQQFSQTQVCPRQEDTPPPPPPSPLSLPASPPHTPPPCHCLTSCFVPVCLHSFQILYYLVAANAQKHWWWLNNEIINNKSLISSSANTFVQRNNKFPGNLTDWKTGRNYQHCKANSVLFIKICSDNGLLLKEDVTEIHLSNTVFFTDSLKESYCVCISLGEFPKAVLFDQLQHTGKNNHIDKTLI